MFNAMVGNTLREQGEELRLEMGNKQKKRLDGMEIKTRRIIKRLKSYSVF